MTDRFLSCVIKHVLQPTRLFFTSPASRWTRLALGTKQQPHGKAFAKGIHSGFHGVTGDG